MKLLPASLLAVLAASLIGCGGDEAQYKPKPAFSGKKASLPAVPTLPAKKKKEGDAYTIWGVTHELRSRVHREDVNGKKISLVGYVVKTNYQQKCADKNNTANKDDCTPECAIHKTGKADPTDCKSPVPTFYIADTKDEQKDMIAVMGWSSNFAQMYTLIEGLKRAPKGKENEVELADEFWGGKIPNPLPAIGAKVKVTGIYGETFTKATSGAATNPKYGIMTYDTMEQLEAAPETVLLPGMRK
ncbi:MAG: hypothetical protein R3B70_41830 [Polyangiaceae bacterium]